MSFKNRFICTILILSIPLSFIFIKFKDMKSNGALSFQNNQTHEKVILGDDRLITDYSHLINGKRVGLITNQTGVTSSGKHIVDILAEYKGITLTAIFSPEHGLEGKSKAGEYVYSYKHPQYNIPVYSLYGQTRKPTKDMLNDIDILIYDIQDIGIRSYTYISTLNYCMLAAKENGKSLIVLDRPNPLGGLTVEGYVAEDKYLSFVGVDNLPVSYGMTIAELASFFNRKIDAKLEIVPMKNYKRSMTFQDTGLTWIPTSPMIPTLESAFNYSATGIGEGLKTAKMGNYFNWVGGPKVDSDVLAKKLNSSKLPGVTFEAAPTSDMGGVNLKITNFKTYNPAKTGIYVLVYIKDLIGYQIPKDPKAPTMFEKIHGTDKIGLYLEEGKRPEDIIRLYTLELEKFKKEREKYLIYK
jgi:uncharacterized protein YbbC (DUF1343 family)